MFEMYAVCMFFFFKWGRMKLFAGLLGVQLGALKDSEFLDVDGWVWLGDGLVFLCFLWSLGGFVDLSPWMASQGISAPFPDLDRTSMQLGNHSSAA